MRCDRCGVESGVEAVFIRTRRSFRTSIATLCPECVRRGQRRFYAFSLILNVVVLTGVGVLFLVDRRLSAKEPLPLIANAYLVSWFTYLCLIPHELGHVLGARLAGMRVFQMTIGQGRRLLAFCCAGMGVEMRLWPVIGYVLASRPDTVGWRWRSVLFIAMGPAVNAALLALALAIIGPAALVPGADALRQILPWHALGLANALLLVTALYPHTLRSALGPLMSDGWQLFRVLSGPVPSEVAQRENYHLLQGSAALCFERYDDAIAAFEQGLEACPHSVNLLLGLSSAEVMARRYEAGRRHTRDALSRLTGPPEVRALVLNNLAWADLMSDPPWLDEADPASREALETLPWDPHCQSTRGAVLVALGELAEGEQLLRRALSRADQRGHRASILCALALAALRRGDVREAGERLGAAERLDPNCERLAGVRREWTARAADAAPRLPVPS